MRGIGVRVRLFAGSRCEDCTDVRLKEVLELLNVPELTIVPGSLDCVSHCLMLSLPPHIELLLSDERDSCVASLQSDGERGVSVAEELLLRESSSMSGEVAQHSDRVIAHAAVGLTHEWKELVVVRCCDCSVFPFLLLSSHDRADKWRVGDCGMILQGGSVRRSSARHIDVELLAVANEEQIAVAIPMVVRARECRTVEGSSRHCGS